MAVIKKIGAVVILIGTFVASYFMGRGAGLLFGYLWHSNKED